MTDKPARPNVLGAVSKLCWERFPFPWHVEQGLMICASNGEEVMSAGVTTSDLEAQVRDGRITSVTRSEAFALVQNLVIQTEFDVHRDKDAPLSWEVVPVDGAYNITTNEGVIAKGLTLEEAAWMISAADIFLYVHNHNIEGA